MRGEQFDPNHDESPPGQAAGEAQFRTIFENMREGAVLHELVYGPGGQAVDYRLVEVNKAFERNTGIPLQRARGALASQVYGGTPPPLLDVYDRAVRSGHSCSFETFLASFQRHFAISVCVLGPGWFATIFSDVSERRWAWDLLRRSEANLARAQAIAHLGNWQWDLLNDVFIGSAEMYRIFGVDPQTFGRKAEALSELLHPDDRQHYRRTIDALREGRQVGGGEYHVLRPDGDIRVVLFSGAESEFDPEGRPVQAFGTVQDITDLKKSEEALAMTQFSVDHAADGLFWMDPDSRIVTVNEAACRELGFTREELLSLTIPEIDPDFPSRVWGEFWENLKANQTVHIETRHRTRDGRVFPVEITANYINFGGREYSCAFVRDLTERKQAEEALQETSRRLRLATASGQLGVWDIDLARQTVFWDDRMFELYGVARENFSNSYQDWQRALHPEDLARAEEELQAAVRGERELDTVFRVVRPDGTVRTIKANGMVIRDEQGQAIRLIGLNRDVTEHRRMEEQLLQSQKMDAIGQLAGGIAHDFNNLLTGILGYANMLKLEAAPGDYTFEAAQTIERAAERASELTRKLLGFARRGKFLAVAVDLNEIVREVNALLSRTIDKNISITQSLGLEDPAVLGDPGQIQQVVLNLAINARDAMAGGGELVIQTGVEDLDQGFCRLAPGLTPGRHAVITVSDTGCGIPDEIRDRIFEPFFTTKEQGKGTGMGLAMVYGIVKNHGGHVGVTSEVGRGTCFKVYLPLHAAAPAQRPPAQAAAWARGKGRILLVDDEAVVLNVAGKMLQNLGYEVLTASGGEEALRLCAAEGPIDLAIIDMVMPRMDGREIFHALRRVRPGLRAILSSGYGIDGRAQSILDEGMRGFIQKPYRMSDLAETVTRALGSGSQA